MCWRLNSRGPEATNVAAFAAYERTMMPSVLGSRSMARVNAKAIVPEAVGG
jgi:hypothetical protein